MKWPVTLFSIQDRCRPSKGPVLLLFFNDTLASPRASQWAGTSEYGQWSQACNISVETSKRTAWPIFALKMINLNWRGNKGFKLKSLYGYQFSLSLQKSQQMTYVTELHWQWVTLILMFCWWQLVHEFPELCKKFLRKYMP